MKPFNLDTGRVLDELQLSIICFLEYKRVFSPPFIYHHISAIDEVLRTHKTCIFPNLKCEIETNKTGPRFMILLLSFFQSAWDHWRERGLDCTVFWNPRAVGGFPGVGLLPAPQGHPSCSTLGCGQDPVQGPAASL